MTRKHNDILDELEQVLVNLKQTTLVGPNFNFVDGLCEEWLKLRGYSVRGPMKYPNEIKTLDDLISLFYELFKKYYPDFHVPYRNEKQDRNIAKHFVNGRMLADGISHIKALQQCATLLEVVFKYREKFNFDSPPHFGMFGHQSMSWITVKAVGLLNKELVALEEKRIEEMIEKQTALVENSEIRFGFWTEEELNKSHKETMNGQKEKH